MTTNNKVAVELTNEEMELVSAERACREAREKEAKERKEAENKNEYERAKRNHNERIKFESEVDKKFIGWTTGVAEEDEHRFEFEGSVHLVPNRRVIWTCKKYPEVIVQALIHKVYGRHSHYGSNKGYKLFVSGPYQITDGLTSRAYTNPKSIEKALDAKMEEIAYKAALKAEKEKTKQSKQAFLSKAFDVEVKADVRYDHSYRRCSEPRQTTVYSAEIAGRTIELDVQGLDTEDSSKSDPRDYRVAGVSFLSLKAAMQIIDVMKSCPVHPEGNR